MQKLVKSYIKGKISMVKSGKIPIIEKLFGLQ
ncbi:hypothetical protein Mucpa_2770 [Mucilaginibacter paludis DSM 18603]|uniref:Uncharacterized protein n=1 Tax=Mucilaginibacter paludis DSM 18603 TaxID=714943 RepID=H1Y8L0_9SPHI|nr:hypothetical protein Mucpa_2770 [Mucilaginibacter paludis DSM 18603]